ncbi:MAG: hypothetical protein GY870_21270 [archaeon]|nr:hypothetical protein [archaeon]
MVDDSLINTYLDKNLNIEERIEDLISKLEISEKISLFVNRDSFSTLPLKRLNIPAFHMTDGPHGCRAQSSNGKKNFYFPSTIGLASSWNTELAYKYGEVLAEEVRSAGKHCVLAPGINIHRTPLNGRNFEYFTEDPFLNSKIVVPLIKGLQSKKIAGCVKHFVCNNSEVRRRFSNSIVNERTLEEIYYPGFRAAVMEADVWSIMGSYNKVNGNYVYEKRELLNEKLRKEWGFSGFVVSDWFATHSTKSTSECIKSGLMLEMPKGYIYTTKLLTEALNKDEITEEDLDNNLRGFFRTLFRVGLFDSEENIPKGAWNTKEHYETARKIIEEGSVLLKNDNNLLPINIKNVKKLCLIGPLLKHKPLIKTFAGSSSVLPTSEETPFDLFIKKLGNAVEFVKKPEDADIVLLFTGNPHKFYGDAEGMDKKQIKLSKKKVKQINKISEKNKNTVIILYGGGPTDMEEWIEQIPSILVVWHPHQEGPAGIYNLIMGLANPSGKLPTTFPKKLKDSPAHKNSQKNSQNYPNFRFSPLDVIKHEGFYVQNPKFNSGAKPIEIHYDEGIYVGYRYFDKYNVEPLFPFGFGLSYTEFDYIGMSILNNKLSEGDIIDVTVKIKNIGKVAGSEIIQIYSRDVECSVDRPPKELIGFMKIYLEPNEEKKVNIEVNTKKLAFYDEKSHSWVLESGEFNIMVGASSRNIKFEEKIIIE